MEFMKAFFALLGDLAWPAAVIAIAVIYRQDIRSILPRLRRAGPGGVELDPVEQQQRPSAAKPDTAELKPLPGILRTAPLEMVERKLHAEAAALPEDQREDLLISALAQAQLSTLFERIYSQIFGTQIAGLRQLNAAGRVTLQDAREFFDQVTATFPDAYRQHGLEGWLEFLRRNNLVRQHDDGSLEITDLGRDFLQYLTGQRLPENKPW